MLDEEIVIPAKEFQELLEKFLIATLRAKVGDKHVLWLWPSRYKRLDKQVIKATKELLKVFNACIDKRYPKVVTSYDLEELYPFYLKQEEGEGNA